MESAARTPTLWVHGIAGLVFLVVGVAGFLGWPRPFDPDTWFIPLMFCALGLQGIW